MSDIKTAMKDAETPEVRLYNLAVAALQAADRVPSKAIVEFMGELRAACPIMFVLFDSAAVATTAMSYLIRRADEMAGKPVRGGHGASEAHNTVASATNGKGDQRSVDHQQMFVSQSGRRSGKGHLLPDAHSAVARPAVPRRTPAKARSAKKALEKIGLIDTLMIHQRNGAVTAIGDLYVSQLEDKPLDLLLKDYIKRGIGYEVLLHLKQIMPAHYDSNHKIRDIFTEQQILAAAEQARHFPTEIQRRFSTEYFDVAKNYPEIVEARDAT